MAWGDQMSKSALQNLNCCSDKWTKHVDPWRSFHVLKMVHTLRTMTVRKRAVCHAWIPSSQTIQSSRSSFSFKNRTKYTRLYQVPCFGKIGEGQFYQTLSSSRSNREFLPSRFDKSDICERSARVIKHAASMRTHLLLHVRSALSCIGKDTKTFDICLRSELPSNQQSKIF